MESSIQVDVLSKSFGNTTALSEVSFTADKGVITGLVGPDGAGKTTLIRLLAGLMRQHPGLSVFVALMPLTKLSRYTG